MAKKPATIDVQEYYDTLRGEFLLKGRRTKVLSHLGERGRNEEERVRGFLRQTLPRRFSVGSGFVVSSNRALGSSPHMDVVIYDDLNNAPIHRELSSDVYPAEMVYATVEVKRLLQKKDLPKILEDVQQLRALGEERWYIAYTSVPKDATNPGQSITGQREFQLSNPKPRSYLIAIGHKGWANINAFIADLAAALEATPTHIHGIAVLDADWFVTLEAYSTPRAGLRPHTGNSLLRFINSVLHGVASMPMHQVSIDRYLRAATPSPPFAAVTPKRGAPLKGRGNS